MDERELDWSWFGQSINWVPCARCGRDVQPHAAQGCWDCQRADERARAREAIYARARFPQTHRWATADHPAVASVAARFGATGDELGRRLIQRILTGPERVITLTGPTRCGKTSIAAAALHERLAHGLFVEASELGAAASAHGFGDGDPPLIARALRVPLLVLDELQVLAIPSQRDAVWRVLHVRHRAGLRTLLTTGVPRAQLVDCYGEGLDGRVFIEALQLDCGSGLLVRGAPVSHDGPKSIGGFRGRTT